MVALKEVLEPYGGWTHHTGWAEGGGTGGRVHEVGWSVLPAQAGEKDACCCTRASGSSLHPCRSHPRLSTHPKPQAFWRWRARAACACSATRGWTPSTWAAWPAHASCSEPAAARSMRASRLPRIPERRGAGLCVQFSEPAPTPIRL